MNITEAIEAMRSILSGSGDGDEVIAAVERLHTAAGDALSAGTDDHECYGCGYEGDDGAHTEDCSMLALERALAPFGERAS